MRNSGFVLLHALWLLLLGVTLAAAALTLSYQHKQRSYANAKRTRVEIAVESAVHQVLYELIDEGRPGRWTGAEVTGTVSVDRIDVAVRVVDAAGLVDLNSADDETLLNLFSALPAPANPQRLLSSLRGTQEALPHGPGRLRGFAEIESLHGMTPDLFACLYPHVTMFTGASTPAPEFTSPWLRQVLHMQDADGHSSVLEGNVSNAGRVYRIEAQAHAGSEGTRRLDAHVRFTGHRDQPYWIYAWWWRARDDAATRCGSDRESG